ncbi:hypothetical protein D3C87_893320 [compost metagenome]
MQLQGLLLALDAVALLLELPLLVEHALHTGREFLGGGEGQSALLAQLFELLERLEPARRQPGQLCDIATELDALMLQAGAALVRLRLLIGELLLTVALCLKKQLQLVLARDQLARGLMQLVTQLEEILLAVALFLEAGQRRAQPLPLRNAGLVFDVTLEQRLRRGPGGLAGGLGGDAEQQRQGGLMLGHRGLGQRQLLLGPQYSTGKALLGGAELMQGVARLFGDQSWQFALRAGRLQRLHRLTVLDGAGLLNVQRLLVVGQLGLEAVYLCLGQLLALFHFQQLTVDLLHDRLLLLELVVELPQIGAIQLYLLLQRHGRHHLREVLGGGLQLVGQQLLAVGELIHLVRQIDGALLLFRQQATLAGQLGARLQGQLGETALLGGAPHILGRHVVGGLGDEVLEQIPLTLGLLDGLQGAAVLVDGRLHVLERLAHPGVLRQQVFPQGTADGRRNAAIQRGFDQAIELAAIFLIPQLFRGDAELEHEVVIIGHRIELGDLHGPQLGGGPLQIGEGAYPALAVMEFFQQQIRGLQVFWHIHQSEGGDVDLVVAIRHLLQVDADPDPLLAAVHHFQQRIAVAALQLAVEPLVTGGAAGARFRGVAKMQQRLIRDQGRDKGRHCGGLARPVAAGQCGDQLVEIEGPGEEAVPVDHGQGFEFASHATLSIKPADSICASTLTLQIIFHLQLQLLFIQISLDVVKQRIAARHLVVVEDGLPFLDHPQLHGAGILVGAHVGGKAEHGFVDPEFVAVAKGGDHPEALEAAHGGADLLEQLLLVEIRAAGAAVDHAQQLLLVGEAQHLLLQLAHGEDPLGGKPVRTQIEVTEHLAHQHVEFGEHCGADVGAGARAQVEEALRRLDEFDLIAAVEDLELAMELHQGRMLFEIVGTDVAPRAQGGVDARKQGVGDGLCEPQGQGKLRIDQ